MIMDGDAPERGKLAHHRGEEKILTTGDGWDLLVIMDEEYAAGIGLDCPGQYIGGVEIEQARRIFQIMPEMSAFHVKEWDEDIRLAWIGNGLLCQANDGCRGEGYGPVASW